jgi:hypothetical protein
VPDGSVDILQQGNKEIDHIFEKIHKHIDQAKVDMKERLKEAYIANYRSTVDKRSQQFLNNLEKLEKYVTACLQDWEKRLEKGKYVVVCSQRPKVEELYKNIDKFKANLQKMVETSREFRNEY